ncbi:LOW QUALITY PROTEIN: vacuolar fusion protein MON1 homolog A-like [Lethenteron reissneri]|uniref:LOW QUALITY PROTEIN: vacuolar fusion protein MON1 homolog A-like n=1 Tax=Lethenteron reissneri TaxID=7753 RepID=UPI002AB717F2|nr:LOW QUALITY PROTEIN: vacuolar fusion protein MON1 homolog A-like [Lethenteron reissneri]
MATLPQGNGHVPGEAPVPCICVALTSPPVPNCVAPMCARGDDAHLEEVPGFGEKWGDVDPPGGDAVASSAPHSRSPTSLPVTSEGTVHRSHCTAQDGQEKAVEAEEDMGVLAVPPSCAEGLPGSLAPPGPADGSPSRSESPAPGAMHHERSSMFLTVKTYADLLGCDDPGDAQPGATAAGDGSARQPRDAASVAVRPMAPLGDHTDGTVARPEGGDAAAGDDDDDDDAGIVISPHDADFLSESDVSSERDAANGAESDSATVAAAEEEAASRDGEDVTSAEWRQHRKHIFVLSEAGKPIYSRHGSEEALSSIMGVMLALVSFVQASRNAIRSIHTGTHVVVFLQRGPLVLVAVSRSRQSEQQLAQELQYVYSQILSVLTATQLNRVFQNKQSYDLRRLLAGTERFLDSLLDLMETDPCFLLSAVRCLPLPGSLRDSVSQSLQQAKDKDLVFSVILAKNHLVSMVRLKEQSLHPADLHLLLNLVSASRTSFSEGEVWLPICLPQFNSSGFFYAHVSYLDDACNLCLLLLCADREAFFTASDCRRRALERMRRQDALSGVLAALGSDSYSVAQTGIPDLRHFMYKCRSTSQFTSPELEAPYCSAESRQRLFDLYQQLHGRVHNAARPLKLIYHVRQQETLLAWVTSGFELYTCFSPLVTKAAAINAITKLLRWIKKEEERLFIMNPLTY